GVIDMRDVVYFAGMTFLFLWFTRGFLRKGTWHQKKFRTNSALFTFFLLIVFVVSGNFLYRLDLTADKRYSLSSVSANMARGLEHPVEVEFYLAGKLEPGLRKLQQEV